MIKPLVFEQNLYLPERFQAKTSFGLVEVIESVRENGRSDFYINTELWASNNTRYCSRAEAERSANRIWTEKMSAHVEPTGR